VAIGFSSLATGNGGQALADLLNTWPSQLLEDMPVAQKDKVRPEPHPEGSSQRLAFAVFDFDVPDGWVLMKKGRHLRLERLAIPSPFRAEFEQQRAGGLINVLSGWLASVLIAVPAHAIGPRARALGDSELS
jgi:hypothetical protein